MWEEIVGLFSGLGWISMLCLAIGVIFLVVEFFIPGFGVFGIVGIIVSAFAIVFKMVMGGTLIQFGIMLSFVVLVILLFSLIFIRSAKYGLISKSPFVEKKTSVSVDYAENKKNFGFLLNKQGVVASVCKPAGKVEIDGNTYSCISNGEYLHKNTLVKVIEVDGSTIVVKKIKIS